MTLRPYSQLGWHMLEALGALELDRTEHPVMRAWALDAIEPGPGEGSRASGKRERLRRMARIMKSGKLEFPDPLPKLLNERARLLGEALGAASKARDAELIPCPNCKEQKPRREIDGSYPYDCCDTCYRNLMGD